MPSFAEFFGSFIKVCRLFCNFFPWFSTVPLSDVCISSAYSFNSLSIIDEFGFLLSLAATTPNEFVLLGDFNIQVGTSFDDTTASDLLNLFSSAFHYAVQEVAFAPRQQLLLPAGAPQSRPTWGLSVPLKVRL